MKPFTGIVLTLGLLLAGCVTPPSAIREAPPGDLQLGEVRDNINAHKDKPVRWGGTILAVQNKDTETWIAVRALQLDSSGRPKSQGQSTGRFLIRESSVLDPATYAVGRKITVVGTLEEEVESTNGNSSPVIKADEHRLWGTSRRRNGYYSDGYRYGHYPYYGHGFYRHHGFHHGFHR